MLLASVESDVHHPIYSLYPVDGRTPNDSSPMREIDEITWSGPASCGALLSGMKWSCLLSISSR
jgi:hypothetical protein